MSEWDKVKQRLEELEENPQVFFEQLRNLQEGLILEYKASFGYDIALDLCPKVSREKGWDPIHGVLEQQILKTIVAFTNTHGGLLILGVGEEKATIVDERQRDKCAKSLGSTSPCHICHKEQRSAVVDRLRINGINQELLVRGLDFDGFQRLISERLETQTRGKNRLGISFGQRPYPCSVEPSKTVQVIPSASVKSLIKKILRVEYQCDDEGPFTLCAILVSPSKRPVYLTVSENGRPGRKGLPRRYDGESTIDYDPETITDYLRERFPETHSASQHISQTTNPGEVAIEAQFWASVQNVNTPDGYQAYLDEYPDGRFARLAQIGRGSRLDLARVGPPDLLTAQQDSIAIQRKGLHSVGMNGGHSEGISGPAQLPQVGPPHDDPMDAESAFSSLDQVLREHIGKSGDAGQGATIEPPTEPAQEPRNVPDPAPAAKTQKRDEQPHISTSGQASLELMFWGSIESRSDPKDLEAYLAKYPNGDFATLAARRLEQLRACQEDSKPLAPAQKHEELPHFPKEPVEVYFNDRWHPARYIGPVSGGHHVQVYCDGEAAPSTNELVELSNIRSAGPVGNNASLAKAKTQSLDREATPHVIKVKLKNRVKNLAAEFGIDHKDILTILRDNGIQVKSFMSFLEDDEAERLRRYFRGQPDAKQIEVVRREVNGVMVRSRKRTGISQLQQTATDAAHIPKRGAEDKTILVYTAGDPVGVALYGGGWYPAEYRGQDTQGHKVLVFVDDGECRWIFGEEVELQHIRRAKPLEEGEHVECWGAGVWTEYRVLSDREDARLWLVNAKTGKKRVSQNKTKGDVELFESVDIRRCNTQISHWESLIEQGYISAASMLYHKAILEYTVALHLHSKDSEAFSYRGHAYMQIGDYDEAIFDFTEAIRLQEQDDDCKLLLGNFLHMRGYANFRNLDFKRAVDDYSLAIDLNEQEVCPDDTLYADRGFAHFCIGEYESALKDYDSAISAVVFSADYYVERALVHEKLLDYVNAELDRKRVKDFKECRY